MSVHNCCHILQQVILSKNVITSWVIHSEFSEFTQNSEPRNKTYSLLAIYSNYIRIQKSIVHAFMQRCCIYMLYELCIYTRIPPRLTASLQAVWLSSTEIYPRKVLCTHTEALSSIHYHPSITARPFVFVSCADFVAHAQYVVRLGGDPVHTMFVSCHGDRCRAAFCRRYHEESAVADHRWIGRFWTPRVL